MRARPGLVLRPACVRHRSSRGPGPQGPSPPRAPSPPPPPSPPFPSFPPFPPTPHSPLGTPGTGRSMPWLVRYRGNRGNARGWMGPLGTPWAPLVLAPPAACWGPQSPLGDPKERFGDPRGTLRIPKGGPAPQGSPRGPLETETHPDPTGVHPPTQDCHAWGERFVRPGHHDTSHSSLCDWLKNTSGRKHVL